MSVYHAKAIGPCMADRRVAGGRACHAHNRIQVIGPGGRVELDFLSSTEVADAIAFQKTLALAAFEERMTPGKMVMPWSVFQEHERARASKSNRLPARL